MRTMYKRILSAILAVAVLLSAALLMMSCGEGRQGEKGESGADGLTPFIGENGNWWIGDTDTGVCAYGRDGQDGKDGKDGKDGEDGNDGLPGENGAPGSNGVNGAPGVSVSSLEINDDGELIVNYSDGTSQNLGAFVPEDGKDGKNGKDGKDGKDGSTIASATFVDGELVVTFDNGVKATLGDLAPHVRINADTREWEVSYDGGSNWLGLGFNAIGPQGDAGRGIEYMEIRDGCLYVMYTDSEDLVKIGRIVEE